MLCEITIRYYSLEQKEVDGICVPTRIEITWHLAAGEFTWFRCKITRIVYNQSGKVMVL
ncbi:MAG: DUF6920 family protein [Ktedonobacteraceae bacterium]